MEYGRKVTDFEVGGRGQVASRHTSCKWKIISFNWFSV